jgi:uncharacterized repeat protein (TIGR03803 family)/autotransporter-associated beta strand protein
MDSTGNLFGTAEYGGPWGDGTVFEIAAGSGTVTTLASFNGSDGASPYAGVIEDASGNLFGTTELGGASNDGTVFEVAKGSGTITTLATFNGANGASPLGGVIEDASGNLFGTTFVGGASGYGTVFEIAAGSGAITTLASFNGTNGEYPYGGVIEDASGNLFGTTESGGASGDGTVFEVAAGSGTITTLASFKCTNGESPYGGVIEDAGGNLFGTTSGGGGGGGYGTVFEIAKGSDAITTLATFNKNNGGIPNAGVIEDASGDLFGTTSYGGASGDGTVFEIATGNGMMATLASFNGTNGASPYGGVIEDASGNLFGTTPTGGASNDGTVFEVAKGSGTITTLGSFNNANPLAPCGGVIEDTNGNLFGTTEQGGASSDGTVFEVAKGSGTFTTVASFDGTNGKLPYAGVIKDASGNLFGTTEQGGASGDGTVFEIAAGSGTITTLATFNGTNGKDPYAGVIEDASGNLFGTTELGGASNDGTVFEIAKGSGTISTLATFDGANGANPGAGVIEDAGGNLFGTTSGGGASGDGTVFEVAKGSGTITTLASFNGTNGSGPCAGLIEDASGNVFGAAAGGGAWNDGTAFEVAKGSKTITVLASFNGTDGDAPCGGVIEDAGGNLFGTTNSGGASAYGTVFEIAKGSGTITTLASFNGSNGEEPNGVIGDTSGNIFGTATSGGSGGFGTVFEIPYADDGPLTGASTATASGGVPGTTAATLSGATFSDANTAPPAGNFSVASVAWGDGSTNASGLSITGTGGNFTVSGSHLYANAGSYPFAITVSDAAGWTGTITGTAVVSPAPATVTLGSLTQTYSGSPEQASVTTIPAGLATSVVYTQNGQPVANPTAAGSYQVVATVTDPNYTGSATGTLLINPAVLTVTADNQTRAYAAADPPLTASFSGFVGSDTQATSVSGTPSLTSSDTATSPVGSYTITVTQGTLAAANYTFTFVNGSLTVTPELLAVNSSQTLDSLEAPDIQATVGAGGQLTVNSPVVLDSTGSVSAVDGGVLTVPGIEAASDAAGVDLDGGTLQASDSFATSTPVTLAAGGGTIDSNGSDVTLGGAMGGSGGLTVTGAGSVVLTGANGYTGGTTVASGLLAAENASAIPGGSLLTIGPGGSVVLGAAGYSELGPLPGGGAIGGSGPAIPPSISGGAIAPAVFSNTTSPRTQWGILARVSARAPAAPAASSALAGPSTNRLPQNPVFPLTPSRSPADHFAVPGEGRIDSAPGAAAIAGTVPAPRSTSHPAIAADQARQADIRVVPRNETRRRDELPSLAGTVSPAWKPDSVARALEAIFASYE